MATSTVPGARRAAGLKAAATIRQRKAEQERRRRQAALNAWVTIRSPVHKARTAARKSQEALRSWARMNGWHAVFLDSAKGNPRTGIVDAILVRIVPRSKDVVELKVVQLKGGSAGLTPAEIPRLEAAARNVHVEALYTFHDGTDILLCAASKPAEARATLRPHWTR